jgi:hypothetical protein
LLIVYYLLQAREAPQRRSRDRATMVGEA